MFLLSKTMVIVPMGAFDVTALITLSKGTPSAQNRALALFVSASTNAVASLTAFWAVALHALKASPT